MNIIKPFRWDLHKSEGLGSLLRGTQQESYPEFWDDLAECSAKVLSFSHNASLYFVGRSPESIYDYLCGMFSGYPMAKKLHLTSFSQRTKHDAPQSLDYRSALYSLREYFEVIGLHPRRILESKEGIAFSDLVYTGGTFANLLQLFCDWSGDAGLSWKYVAKKIWVVGIVSNSYNPHTIPWYRSSAMLKHLPHSHIRNVTIPGRLWDYLGNRQKKVMQSYCPKKWGKEDVLFPLRSGESLEALRLAFELFHKAGQKHSRRAFARLLSQQSAMQYDWYRSMVIGLKEKG